MTSKTFRRKRTRQSGLGMIVFMLAHIHWFINLMLAAGAWLWLTHIQQAQDYGRHSLSGALEVAVYYAIYAVPAVFVIAALIGFVRGRKRRALLNKVIQSGNTAKALSSLDWREFELLVGQMFRADGYNVVEGEGIKDGGVDLTLRKGGRTYLVQCKHWQRGSVGVSVVRELYGVMSLHRAHHAYVVCSGKFTRDAANFARKAGVSLIGLEQLESALQRLN